VAKALRPCSLLDLVHPRCDLAEGLLPTDLLPFVADSPQRPTQPIRILVNVPQRHRLGTDVTAAERVFAVAADGHDPLALHLDAQTARRLAQGAGREAYGTGLW
jgi:hypothetical protein